MKQEEVLTMGKLLNELQSVDTMKLVLTGCGESIYGSREVYEAIRPFVEKQVPKKLEIDGEFDLLCAGCGSVLDFKGYDGDYCPYCGQRMDWSESE